VNAWLRDPKKRRLLIFGAAGAAVVLLLFLRRRSAAAAATTAATTTGDVGPLVDPSTLTNGIPNALDGSGSAGGVTATSPTDLAPLTDQLGSLQDQISALGDKLDTGTPVDAGAQTTTAAAPTAAATSPTAPSSAQRTPGFWWGIGGHQTWVTAKNRPLFLAELRKHGTHVDAWAANHPQAARDIGLNPPPAPPPIAPGHSSPAHELGGPARAAIFSSVTHRPAVLTAAPVTITARGVTQIRSAARAPAPAPVRHRVAGRWVA
jgi:hypothetical protein